MKKKLIYALGALMTIGVTSCELTEKPSSFYEMDTYFTTTNKAKMAVVGIYDCLATEGYYGQFVMPFWTSDDMHMIRGTGTGDGTRRDISHYAVTASNNWIESVWSYIYQGIDRANLAIAGIEGMTGYEESEELKELVAEAKFLRAFMAFDLIRFWGDVPFKTEYTAGYDQAYQPRTDREDIYDVIIEDLNFAKQWLNPGNEVANSEVPCRGAARALLMRVYLQRAGYSLDRATRQLTRPDDTKRQEYFDAVIDEWGAFQAEGYHNFYGAGFEQCIKNYSQLIVDNQESLWEIAFEPNNGEKDNSGYWATYNGPLVAAPEGIDPSENSKYMGRANAFVLALPAWQDFYELNDDGTPKDVRRDVTIVDYRYTWNTNKKEHQQKAAQNGWVYPGKWRREWMALGFVNPNYTGVNYCPLRYSDVVLMAAEAYNETGETPTAWTLLNSVRTRANATAITDANYAELMKAPKVYDLNYIDDSDAAGKFRTALYWERGFELAFEGQRKYDLIRWGILGDALRFFQNQLEPSYASSNYIAGTNFVDGKHELFPIPLSEIQANGALNGENNPGYE